MDSLFSSSECSCRPSATSSNRPQNRYLCYLLDEFEKCTQQSNDLSRLQKEHQNTRKDLSEAIKDVKELKMGRQLQADKLTTIQRELQEQKLLHSQLRDEVSTEFRSLYQKIAGQQKSIDLLKYQVRVNTKKFSLDVENLRWEMTTNRKLDMPSLTDLELGRKERE